MTAKRMRSLFRVDDSDLTYKKDLHDSELMKEAIQFAKTSDLITYFYKNPDNKSKLIKFAQKLVNGLEAVRKSRTKNIFE